MANKIPFVDTDPDAVLSQLKAHYESITSKKLQPAQVETLVLNSAAYRISLLLNQVNETANQCLVAFSAGAALEELASLLGVVRLPASPAATVIRFQLVDGHAALTVDQGIRIQSGDGQAIFITTEAKTVTIDDTYVDIKCECTKNGAIGNDYAPGGINIILDPRAYVSSAANLTTTAGGSNDETDEELRERVLLAPASFSVAGPKGAYKFWAKTAHPTIVDVAVTIGHETIDPFDIIPGQVDIFPLLINNATPTVEITDAIYAICNDEKIRPLSDTVVVKSPTQRDYTMEINLTILTDGIAQNIIDAVTAKLEAYRDARKNKLGIDVVRNQIIGVCQAVEKVYSTDVVSPVDDIEALENEFTNCTSIVVNVTNTHDE